MEPKAFIFDLDGVITDTAEYHYQAWKKLTHDLGFDMNREFNENLKGVSRMASLELLLEKEGLQDKYTDEEKKELATKKNEDYKELILQMTPDEVLPGITTMLAELKSRGIKIGLASASKNAMTVLKQLEMTDDFEYVADAAQIKHSKPAPDVFLDVAEAFGVDPKECIGVEDAQAGIEAIKAAGMFAVAVGDEHLEGMDLLYKKTADFDVDAIIAAYNKR